MREKKLEHATVWFKHTGE